MTSKSAFTLAEVLITLVIIGIVAAMTIPSLVTKINEKVKDRQIQVFNKKINQGFELMQAAGKLGPYYNSTYDFVQEYSKYTKIIKVCSPEHNNKELTECWPKNTINFEHNKIYNINDSKNKTGNEILKVYDGEYDNVVGIVLANGTPMLLSYNKQCPLSDPDSVTYTSDTNGKSNISNEYIVGIYDINGRKGPNMLKGTKYDILPFNNAFGFGRYFCSYEIGSLCFVGEVFKPKGLTYAECVADVGISDVCRGLGGNPNMFAGIIKRCGGIDNLPTLEDLAMIASDNMYMYSRGSNKGKPVKYEEKSDCYISIGNPDSEAYKFIFANDREGYTIASSSIDLYLSFYRTFYKNYTTYSNGYKSADYLYGLCKLSQEN